MMPTVILLAGGLGTRLRCITDDRIPKPMVPVAYQDMSYPFLEFLLGYLHSQGVSRVVICIDHLGEKIESYFGDGKHFNMDIQYDKVTDALTAARIKHAMTKVPENDFIVHCGDIYHPMDLDGFFCNFMAHPEYLMQIAVLPASVNASVTSNVSVNGNGLVSAYATENIDGPRSGLETGILAVRKEALHSVPDTMDISITENVYPELISRQALGAYASSAMFFDIGTPDEYARFSRYVQTHGIKPISKQ